MPAHKSRFRHRRRDLVPAAINEGPAPLAIARADDPLESEADKIADRVTQVPANSVVMRKCEGCEAEDELRMKPLAGPSFAQAKHASGAATAPETASNAIARSRGGGESLPRQTRSFMEARFGADFGNVRVHHDADAAETARALSARAFTVGADIHFGAGQFAPDTAEGSKLLAHELVHTLQQSGKEPPAGGQAAILQRAVTTSGGDWDTDNYDAVKDLDMSGNAVPAAQNMRGADITLRFKPNNNVNAELLGLVQSVQSYVGGALALTPAASTRAIPAADAKAINTGKGETDEGTAIDRAAGYNNPIYPVRSVASASLADKNISAGWGQLGWYYKDNANTLQHQDATLIDSPRRAGANKDSRQIFEVTALATKGVQAGTYYGSVRWGWRTDSAAKLTKIDLQKVSDGVPSSTFTKAAGIWDKGKSSTGAANVKLGMPEIMVTTMPVTLTPQAVVMLPIVLPIGTRVQIISGFQPPFSNTDTVMVVDGPHAGLVGDIPQTGVMPMLPTIVPERA